MYTELIIKPILTEKMAIMEERENKFAFLVDISANKTEIKKAVENLFKVKVKAVNTSITKGKRKRFRGRMGKLRNIKRAYVMLEEGNTIDVTTGL